MGLDGPDDSGDGGDDSNNIDEALDGAEELLPRIKIFLSNVNIHVCAAMFVSSVLSLLTNLYHGSFSFRF